MNLSRVTEPPALPSILPARTDFLPNNRDRSIRLASRWVRFAKSQCASFALPCHGFPNPWLAVLGEICVRVRTPTGWKPVARLGSFCRFAGITDHIGEPHH